MSESVLKFGQIIGQDGAIRMLRSTLPPNQPGNGYLFTGPEGVGKVTTAMAWARALFCQGAGQDACGRCGPCLKVEDGAHPDLLTIRPQVKKNKVTEEIDIVDVRGLIERLYYKPYEANRKIAIIDSAEKMNLAASSAFLKTLEEPPGDTVIILSTSNPSKAPSTITSRCQVVRFLPAPADQMAKYLVERRGFSEEEARTLAVMSGGRLGAADPERLNEDIAQRRLALDFVAGARNEPAVKYLKLAQKMDKSKDRAAVDKFLVMVFSVFRELAVMKITGKYDKLIYKDIIGELEEAGRDYTPKDVLNALSLLERLMASRTWNINPLLTVSLLYYELKS